MATVLSQGVSLDPRDYSYVVPSAAQQQAALVKLAQAAYASACWAGTAPSAFPGCISPATFFPHPFLGPFAGCPFPPMPCPAGTSAMQVSGCQPSLQQQPSSLLSAPSAGAAARRSKAPPKQGSKQQPSLKASKSHTSSSSEASTDTKQANNNVSSRARGRTAAGGGAAAAADVACAVELDSEAIRQLLEVDSFLQDMDGECLSAFSDAHSRGRSRSSAGNASGGHNLWTDSDSPLPVVVPTARRTLKTKPRCNFPATSRVYVTGAISHAGSMPHPSSHAPPSYPRLAPSTSLNHSALSYADGASVGGGGITAEDLLFLTDCMPLGGGGGSVGGNNLNALGADGGGNNDDSFGDCSDDELAQLDRAVRQCTPLRRRASAPAPRSLRTLIHNAGGLQHSNTNNNNNNVGHFTGYHSIHGSSTACMTDEDDPMGPLISVTAGHSNSHSLASEATGLGLDHHMGLGMGMNMMMPGDGPFDCGNAMMLQPLALSTGQTPSAVAPGCTTPSSKPPTRAVLRAAAKALKLKNAGGAVAKGAAAAAGRSAAASAAGGGSGGALGGSCALLSAAVSAPVGCFEDDTLLGGGVCDGESLLGAGCMEDQAYDALAELLGPDESSENWAMDLDNLNFDANFLMSPL